MRKNQSINVVVRFIGQALRVFNKPVLSVPSIEGNIIEELSDYNDMLNELSDYSVRFHKQGLNHA